MYCYKPVVNLFEFLLVLVWESHDHYIFFSSILGVRIFKYDQRLVKMIIPIFLYFTMYNSAEL